MQCMTKTEGGSPPPTRGILPDLVINPMYVGITPAYAGNTLQVWTGGVVWRDHPRLRGEYDVAIIDAHRQIGSPPPTRGIRSILEQVQPPRGITPAYAGNTETKCDKFRSEQDHPRLRGEYAMEQLKSTFDVGSPPPTRGILKKGHR